MRLAALCAATLRTPCADRLSDRAVLPDDRPASTAGDTSITRVPGLAIESPIEPEQALL
jgi:hypothetical protein